MLKQLSLAAILVTPALQAPAQDTLLTGERLTVVDLTADDSDLNYEIQYIRVADDATYEVVVTNNEEQPISIVATVVFYDITAAAFFVNGGFEYAGSGELISQAQSGTSVQATRCFNILDQNDGAFGGGYNCAKNPRVNLSSATSVLVIISKAFIDDADRD